MANFPCIPGYALLNVLGEGGVAKVYLAIQEKLNREVAIKILEPFFLKNKVTATRFEKEAKTAASLSHSNVIQIFDIDKTDDYHYIVMEYLQESLRDKMNLNPQRKMHPEIALDILEKLMAALDYAHFKGIYHRDIKPENIMFKQDSTPVLVDFGIARIFDSSDELTKSGQGIGTSYYMSPEQCKAQKIDGRSDIYSLGVVLYEMLTGEKPYKGESPISIALQHIEAPMPKLPGELARYQPLIDEMMAKDKEKRPSSGAELLRVLDNIMFSLTNNDSQPIVIPSFLPEEPQSPEPLLPLADSPSKKPKTFLKKIFFLGISVVVLIVISSIIFINDIGRTTMDQPSYYHDNLKRIDTLYRKGDLKNLKNGLALIQTSKKRKETVALNTLEKKFTHRIDQLEKEFKGYLENAKNYFEKKKSLKAKESILKAKQIKTTRTLELLENDIEIYIGKQNKQKEERQKERKKKEKDDQAYKTAYSKHTIEAFRKYLEEFPTGLHIKRATEKLNALRKVAQKQLERKLRSEYKSLDKNEVSEMVKRYNFFENRLNESGAFRGRHESMERDDRGIVIDHITGLMWYNGNSTKVMNIKNAETWIEKMNSDKYAGYDDWRFPTIEEAASLLQKNKNPEELHIVPIFSAKQPKIWSKDSSKKDMAWVEKEIWIVCFDSGTVDESTQDKKHHIRPVRSLKKEIP